MPRTVRKQVETIRLSVMKQRLKNEHGNLQGLRPLMSVTRPATGYSTKRAVCDNASPAETGAGGDVYARI